MVLLCRLIPLDVVLFDSELLDMLAVVSTLDSFGMIHLVLVLRMILCIVLGFLYDFPEVPVMIGLLLALLCLSVRLSHHHGLQFAFQ